jgi:large subunit ribosomal protein L23
MDLSIYEIIQRPHVSSKAYALNQHLQQLVLEVHPQANKPLVKEALKKLFNVEVEKVRIIVSKGKIRRAGRHEFRGKKKKKAIVTLKAGYSTDMMSLGGPIHPSETAPANK